MDAGDYKKASTCYLIGNVFNKGIAFLTVPIFTRILSTSDYGIVTTYNSWIGIVTMLLGFALHMAIRSSFIDYREKVDEYLTSTLLFTVAFSVSMTVIVCSVSVLLNLSIPFIEKGQGTGRSTFPCKAHSFSQDALRGRYRAASQGI